MNAKALTHETSIEGAAAPSITLKDGTLGRAKNGSLGSLKLSWLEQVAYDRKLPNAAVRVALLIAKHVNERDRRAWPKMSTLAGHVGWTERTVRDSIHVLARRRHLACSKRGSGNLNQYELLLNDLTVEDRTSAAIAVDALSSKRDPRRFAKAKPEDTPGERGEVMSPFESFMSAFPAQDREYSRAFAEQRYQEHLAAGVTACTILAGAKVYHEFCDAHGYTETQKVCAPAYWLKIKGWLARNPDDLLEGAER